MIEPNAISPHKKKNYIIKMFLFFKRAGFRDGHSSHGDIFILYFKNKYSSFFFVVWLPAFVTDLFCVLRAVPSFPMVIYHVHGVDGGVVTGCGEASIVGGPSVTHADKGGH